MVMMAAKRCESGVCGHCIQPCVLGTLSSGLRLDLRDFPDLKERHLARGDYLFHTSGSFESLYAVRSGMLKVTVLTEDGREQITGFFLPGDLVGLDSVGLRHHASSAAALDDTVVCELPFSVLERHGQSVPRIQAALFRMLSGQIRREQSTLLLLGSLRAEERLAQFLIDMSERANADASCGTAIGMPMTREEIGSYLGLKLETVSRTLSKLHREGVIEVIKRGVRIREENKLRLLAGLSVRKPATPALRRTGY
jgi:CRP/FNR family transcriptional regulator, anaerobic regulatory protein